MKEDLLNRRPSRRVARRRQVVRRLLFWVGLALLVMALLTSWETASRAPLPSLWQLVESALALTLAGLLMGAAWAALLETNYVDAASAYLRSQVMKYFPLGGAVQAFAQMSYSRGLGMRASIGGAFVGFVGVSIGTASLIAGLGAWFVEGLPKVVSVAVIAGVLLIRPILSQTVKLARMGIGRAPSPDSLPSQRILLKATVLQAFAFTLFGLSLLPLLSGSGNSVYDVVVVAIASWLAGFLIVPLPSGIGVREVVLVTGLGGALGTEVVLRGVVMHRLVAIVADLLGLVLIVAAVRVGARRERTNGLTGG